MQKFDLTKASRLTLILESSKMNRFSIFSEFITQRKQLEATSEEKDVPKHLSADSVELPALEAAALTCVLLAASHQLFIIDIGTCSTSPEESNIIVRKKIRDTVDQTMKEVGQKRTFKVLAERVLQEKEGGKREANLHGEMRQNRRRIEDLILKVKTHELAKSKEMNRKQEMIAVLKDKIHEEVTRSQIKLKYADRWETARRGQNRIRCQSIIHELEQNLETMTNKCKNEERVHEEMCLFLRMEEQRLEGELKNWIDRYLMETKKKQEKMKFLRTKRKEQQILLRDMSQLFEERKREIDEYLEFKEDVRKEEDRRKLVNDMATRIQAWWRGTMVRRGLGPFKKKKKREKDKRKNK